MNLVLQCGHSHYMTSSDRSISTDFAAKAAEAADAAATLMPGTYDAVLALASVSIAASLVRIADALERN